MSAFAEAPAIVGAPDPAHPAAGHEHAFADVYDLTAELVWRAVGRLGVPEPAVEDVVQEVFLVVHRRLAEFEGRSSVRTWVYGIAVHAARAHRRTMVRRPLAAQGAAGVEPETLRDDPRREPDALLERAQATQLLGVLLDQLEPDLREVFVLAELEEMTAAEIGEVLGISPNTVSSRLRLARRDFDRALTRERARDEWRIR
jgi:RNA polymerase sigma-70 factor (ECF subfamily)